MFDLIFDPIADARMQGAGRAETVLILLPGAGMRADDYRSNGFCDALRERGLAVDVALAETSAEHYLKEDFGRSFGDTVVAPMLEGGRYRQVWLGGISLGAYGALRVLQACSERINGVLLLAPFLFTRGMIAGILKSGGLDQWAPDSKPHHAVDVELLGWIKENLGMGKSPVETWLGWGEQDRYADAAKLLAARLPRERVFHIAGDHNWPTWKALWRDMLDAAPFAAIAEEVQ